MDGDYEVDDLGSLLAVATANANNIEASASLWGSCSRSRQVNLLAATGDLRACQPAAPTCAADPAPFQHIATPRAGIPRPDGRVQLAGRPPPGCCARCALQHASGQPAQHRGALRRRWGRRHWQCRCAERCPSGRAAPAVLSQQYAALPASVVRLVLARMPTNTLSCFPPLSGNDMYKLFLDDSMTYSCGIWAPGELTGPSM